MATVVGFLSFGLVLALTGLAATVLLLRRVNQKCNALTFTMAFDTLFSRIVAHRVDLSGERAKRASARALRDRIEDLCHRQGVLPEALLLVALLNDVGDTLADIDWDAGRMRDCIRAGEIAGSRSGYLDLLTLESAEEAAAETLIRFAADIGRPMPRAVRRALQPGGEGQEVGTMVERLMSDIASRVGAPAPVGAGVHELQAAARAILADDVPAAPAPLAERKAG